MGYFLCSPPYILARDACFAPHPFSLPSSPTYPRIPESPNSPPTQGCTPVEASSTAGIARDGLAYFLMGVNIVLFVRFAKDLIPAVRNFVRRRCRREEER